MEAPDSFFVRASSLNEEGRIVADNTPTNFVFEFPTPYYLEDGKYEVGLVEVAHPLPNIVRPTDDATVKYSLFTRTFIDETLSNIDELTAASNLNVAVPQNGGSGSKVTTLNPGYYDMHTLAESLNIVLPPLISDDHSKTLSLTYTAQWEAIRGGKFIALKVFDSEHMLYYDYQGNPEGILHVKVEWSDDMRKLMGTYGTRASFKYPFSGYLRGFAHSRNEGSELLIRSVYQVGVECDIIQPSVTGVRSRKIIKNITHPGHTNLSVIWTAPTAIEYHRVMINPVTRFRIRLLDHKGEELAVDNLHEDETYFTAHTFMTLHFRRIGMDFSAGRAPDMPIKQAPGTVEVFGKKRRLLSLGKEDI